MRRLTKLFPFLGMLIVLAAAAAPAAAEPKQSFRVAWSIYVGWMPWAYAEESGILDRWADKYGIDIEVVQINDYIESINQFTVGAFDGCVMTNMDALSIPAAGGVDSTALIVGDFSNGNDGIVSKGIALADLAGSQVNLVELSVSHYLLARALDSVAIAEKDLKLVNTSDADIVAAYVGADDVNVVVTWNPLLSELTGQPGTGLLFDSSSIPGEIIDMMVVNTGTLDDNPAFGKALVGAWWEVMGVMSRDDEAGRAARSFMADKAGTDLAGYDAQLATTRMFYDASEAVEFVLGDDLVTTMDYVRNFLFDHGILGEGAPSPDYVGIVFPDGRTLGDAGNVKLRFTEAYMRMAADGMM